MTESILEEAQRIIHGERNATYGHPRDQFNLAARLWSEYLGVEVTADDHAVMMILLKVSRLKTGGYHRDAPLDIAGYAGTMERLREPVAPAAELVTEPATELDTPLDNGPWETLDDVPYPVRVVYAPNGCRWQNYGPDPVREYEDGLAYTRQGWLWSSQHSAEHGYYSFSKDGPFTPEFDYTSGHNQF